MGKVAIVKSKKTARGVYIVKLNEIRIPKNTKPSDVIKEGKYYYHYSEAGIKREVCIIQVCGEYTRKNLFILFSSPAKKSQIR
jgi:hypothetical protein